MNPETIAAGLTEALAKRDAVDKLCPYKRKRTPSSERVCPKCFGTSETGCHLAHAAAHEFVATVRAILESRDAD